MPAAPDRADTRDRANEPAVLAAAGVTVLLWASAFIVIRDAGAHLHPGSLALLRMAVGTVALGVIAAIHGIRMPPPRALPAIAAWGVGMFAVYNLALNTAERTIDAGTAAMLVNLAPLLVVLVGGLFLGEGFPRGLVLGAPVSFFGVVLIATQSWAGHLEAGGLVLSLVAALMYAASVLAQKRLLRSLDPTTLTWLGALAGTLALLPWSGTLARDLAAAPTSVVLSVVYLGLFPTALAFTTWAYVLGRTSAGRTAATTYVVPAIAIVMSWLFLSEAPTLVTLIGGALCLFGVFLTRLNVGSSGGARHTGAPSGVEAGD